MKKVFLLFQLLLFSNGLLFSQVRNIQAMNDTIDLIPGIPVVYDILANDTLSATDTIGLIQLNGGDYVICQKIHGSTWVFTFTFPSWGWGHGGEQLGYYRLFTMSMDTSFARILFRLHDESYSYLDMNNVSARFTSSGLHFWNENAEFEVPKGSGKTSIFSNSFWIGGVDEQNILHFAGERYRQGPTGGPAKTKPDFYAGPVMDSVNYSIYQDTLWNYIWNLKKTDIAYHQAHYWETGYAPIHDILTWPGNGNVALGQAAQLAPFYDQNGNGIYEPFDGDYPVIRGDQCLFFIFNDDRGPHLESQGNKLRAEIHGMAYAWDIPNDTAFKNTIFLSYKIFNRSQHTYDSVYLGMFTDIDLGYAGDDYIGCDVERSMYFGYNGTPIDGTGQPYAYGENPPAQGIIFMGGPLMEPDGFDNPRFDNEGHQLCNESVNGINFGDGISDNERLGMRKFVYMNNSNGGVPNYMTDPLFAPEYYQFLRGIWKDGTRMIYGGNAHIYGGGYGPECDFMFPGESDTLNWGNGCMPPNGPVNWTETTAGNNPNDRHCMGSSGPFAFHPGDVQDLDIAFTWARDYESRSAESSLAKLRIMTDIVNNAFVTNTLPNGYPFVGMANQVKNDPIPVSVYPNPASRQVSVVFSQGMESNATIGLYSIQGKVLLVKEKATNENKINLDISELEGGFYFIRITTGSSVTAKKILVIR